MFDYIKENWVMFTIIMVILLLAIAFMIPMIVFIVKYKKEGEMCMPFMENKEDVGKFLENKDSYMTALKNAVEFEKCSADLIVCQGEKDACAIESATCGAKLDKCNGEKKDCTEKLDKYTKESAECTAAKDAIVNDVNTCKTSLAACQAPAPAVTPTPAPAPAPAAPAPVAPAPVAPVAPVVPSVTGRYVRLLLSTNGLLNIGEVRIFSADPNVNIALRKPVVQSSAYNATRYPPSNLVDGNINTFAHTNAGVNSMMTIDLSGETPITNITIVNRVDCCKERINNTKVLILDKDEKEVFVSDAIQSQNGFGNSIYVIKPPRATIFYSRDSNPGSLVIPVPAPANLVFKKIHKGYGSTGLCVDVPDSSTDVGVQLVGQQCKSPVTNNQLFGYDPDSKMIFIKHSGQCLTVKDKQVVQDVCQKIPEQQWELIPDSGVLRIVNRTTDKTLNLNYEGSVAPNSKVIVTSPSGQLFRMV